MDKIIIFGLGKVFNDNLKSIDFKSVVCICDNNSVLNSVYGCEVIRPERIKEFEFDYIVIFNKKNIKEIYNQLIELGVEDCKIVSWAYYLCCLKYNTSIFSFDAPNAICTVCHDLYIDRILDIDSGILRDSSFEYYFNKYVFDISVFPQIKKKYNNNFYTSVETVISSSYDAALFLDYFLDHSINELKSTFEEISEFCRYIIMTIPYPCPTEFTLWDEIDFSSYGYVKIINLAYSKLIVIDTYSNLEHYNNIEIYTVTHKVFDPLKNPIYHPIFAGKTSENDMHIQGDADGDDNIACYNKYINECTSLYWIWKNSKADIIGLTHYRRYIAYTSFWDDWKRNIIDAPIILKLLNKYDILVLPGYGDFPISIKEHLYQTVNKSAFSAGYEGIRNIIKEKYPCYLNDFDIYFNGVYTHPCNMFVARKEIVNAYCNWLFDIILEACKTIYLDSYDSYSCRIIGFIAERLLTLWIKHNHIRIKEMNLVSLST